MKNKRFRFSPGTVINLNALPEELRTRRCEDYDEGILTTTEPITVLSRKGFPVVAEIIRMCDYFGEDDSATSFEIRLVDPGACGRQLSGAITIEYEPDNLTRGSYGDLLALLNDAEAYIEGLESQ